MIQSMTGFGEARLDTGDHAYHLEIRSVNNRYLKTVVHLPDDYGFLESEVERLLRARLTRGSVTLRAHVRDLSPEAAQEINTGAVRAYVEQLRALQGGDERITIDLATLLTLPGACQPHELTETERAEKWQVIEGLVKEALDRLVEMRSAEGETLAADLVRQCAQIRQSLETIAGRTDKVVAEYRDRLLARVQQLLAGSNVTLAAEDLVKEVSVYAERSDINEEVSRLSAHLDQFDKLMNGDGAPGRKLEFVAQEMLREANTMGSKSGDPTIAREIVEIKGAIDRIKEQVQNAE